jgi:hypothetical protein
MRQGQLKLGCFLLHAEPTELANAFHQIDHPSLLWRDIGYHLVVKRGFHACPPCGLMGTAQRSAAGVQASSLNKTPSLNRWQFTFRFSEIRRVSRCTICCAAQVQPTHLRRATSTSRRVAGHCWSDDRRPLRRHELSELLICLFASRTHSSVRSPRQMPCNILIEIPTNNTHASITINAPAPTTE